MALSWLLTAALIGAEAAGAAGRPAGPAQASPAAAAFEFSFSEKLDAAVFLNAISDNPRFNEPWQALRKEWRAKFAADPEASKALEGWLGRGIQLAYLLSTVPGDGLKETLKRFDDAPALVRDIRAGLDEPAYEAVLRDLEARPGEVKTVLAFLDKNGFARQRTEEYGRVLDETLRAASAQTSRVDAGRFVELLEAFTGRRVPGRKLRVRVLAFANPLSFQLSGFAVGWGTQKGSLAWLLAHEFLHKYNPTRENLALQARLAKEDPFYAEAWERIYGEFEEGKEEEFVEAAARFVLLKLGLASPARNLRSMKLLYFSEKTKKAGAPLAAVLYDGLAARGPAPKGFDYNRFIAGEFASGRAAAGKLEESYRRVIKPVSGLAGMVIKEDPRGARVEKVFETYPAFRAGIGEGDVLTEVNAVPLAGKSLDELLDLFAGESGATFEVKVRGTLRDRKVRFALK